MSERDGYLQMADGTYTKLPERMPDPPSRIDPVNHPPHYTYGPIEVIDVIDGFGLDYWLGNAVKYILRHGHKGGPEDAAKDLEKAAWYLADKIKRLKQ